MLELKSNVPTYCNADALAENEKWPAGFFFTHKPFIAKGLKIANGTSYALPVGKYKVGDIGEDATVICYCGPATTPAIDVYHRGLRIVGGVQVQRGEYYRQTFNGQTNVGLWKKPDGTFDPKPNRDGSVGIRFGRTTEAPGGKSLIDMISFVGFDRAIHIKDEANHITIQFGIFQDNWTNYRSDHDQSFGVHFGHMHQSGYCDTVMDCERGGRWHIEWFYSNSGALLARFRNLGPNRSYGSVGYFHLDSNANDWRMIDAPDAGPCSLTFNGGLIAKAAVPRAGWKNFGSPRADKILDYTRVVDPAKVLSTP